VRLVMEFCSSQFDMLEVLEIITPDDAEGYFAHAGYFWSLRCTLQVCWFNQILFHRKGIGSDEACKRAERMFTKRSKLTTFL
jgi:hypothetical protein